MSRSPHFEPLAILGTGAVGGALAVLWSRAGVSLVSLASRDGRSARSVRRACRQASGNRISPRATASLTGAAEPARWLVLSVPDDGLAGCVRELSDSDIDWSGRVVLHTSGFHGSAILDPLAEQGARVGTIHPLQSVPSRALGIERIPGSPMALAPGPAVAVARRLARAADGKPFLLEDEARPLYHAAAVLASNGFVALVEAAVQTLAATGMSERQALQVLTPLVAGTLDNLRERTPRQALTGPVARGDVGTVRGHLDVLPPEAAGLYRKLSEHMLSLAEVTPQQAAALRRLFAKG